MQGRRKGLATLIRSDVLAAIPVHCFEHYLNLCLQDAGRKVQLLRDSIDIVREIVGFIYYSPKRAHLFNEKMLQSEGPRCGIKPLCPTRWTLRTEAIDALIKQYCPIMETMQEVHQTTRDDYGLKAAGVLIALEKCQTLFGLKLGHLLFGAAEETLKLLQTKHLSIQEAVSAVSVTRSFYEQQRDDGAFDVFFDTVTVQARSLPIGEPKLPRYRRPPKRLGGSDPHQFSDAREFFRQQYFSACDLLIQELVDIFQQKEMMQPLITMKSVLVKSGNDEAFHYELK